jgi:hypothetical protein
MTTRVLLAGLAATMLLAGCAQGQAQPDGVGLAKTEEIGRTAVQYAQCMRDNGYPQVPDPTFDDEGLPQWGQISGIVKSPEFDATRRTCAEPLTAALRAAGVPNPKEIKPDELLGFARCMREHGIEVPDPTAEEPLALPKGAFDSPAWEPAKQACAELLPASWRGVLEPKTEGAK